MMPRASTASDVVVRLAGLSVAIVLTVGVLALAAALLVARSLADVWAWRRAPAP